MNCDCQLENEGRKKYSRDFTAIYRCLQDDRAFTFVRFSDGETEILRNRPLRIEENVVSWSRGTVDFSYPRYDHKRFDPTKHENIRNILLQSARYYARNYFKGIPGGNNKATEDKGLLIELNGDSLSNLTSADLLINSNYKKFLSLMLPRILAKANVVLIGNYRMDSSRLSSSILHLPIPDDAFANFEVVVDDIVRRAVELPLGAVLLSSASSLSNVIGYKLHQLRSDLTFIDVGTALHPFTGMDSSKRLYLTQLEPWSRRTFVQKSQYLLSGTWRRKW